MKEHCPLEDPGRYWKLTLEGPGPEITQYPTGPRIIENPGI